LTTVWRWISAVKSTFDIPSSRFIVGRRDFFVRGRAPRMLLLLGRKNFFRRHHGMVEVGDDVSGG
jgi:hypothetical protein